MAHKRGHSPSSNKQHESSSKHVKASNGDHEGGDAEPHQQQAGKSTHREEDQWKHAAPYRVHDTERNEKFDVKWRGECHCGRVSYQLSRAKPLLAKYCHCTTCQRLHGAPFQWAAIFHKEDINFTNGHHDLVWYDPSQKSTSHHLPCKVQCGYCKTPIMDEGRNMILLFPTLLEGITTKKGRDAFKVQCHMFYPQRVVDIRDGIAKWSGMDGKSKRLDEEGKEVEEDGDEDGDEGGDEGGGENEDGKSAGKGDVSSSPMSLRSGRAC